jgi:hypothetical protein
MADSAVGAVTTIFKAVTERLEAMKLTETLAVQARKRLEGLWPLVNELCQQSVTDQTILNNLLSNLEEMHKLLDQVQNKSCCRRFFCIGSKVGIFTRFDSQITGLVGDLNLALGMEERKNPDRRPQETAKLEEAKNLKALHNPVAEKFYKQHYNGHTEVTWEVFWYHFRNEHPDILRNEHPDILQNENPEIGDQDVYFLEEVIKTECDADRNGLVHINELDTFFLKWIENKDNILSKARLERVFAGHVDLYQSPCQTQLQLRLKYVEAIFPFPHYAEDAVITITSKGIPGKPPTRITKFGKGESSQICFHPEDVTVERDVFQIYANSDGYYIIDAYNLGQCNIKPKKGAGCRLIVGRIVTLGTTSSFHVLEASETLLRIKFHNGGGELERQTLEFPRRQGEAVELGIGSDIANQICVNTAGLSRVHAKITNNHGFWSLTDCSKNGTWVNLKIYDSPTIKPWKLNEGEAIGTQFYRFEVLSVA